MSDPAFYTVGWICALEVEFHAAKLMLDKEHKEGPCIVSPNDSNSYILGNIGTHNVVIASLPMGEYGTASAAKVAANMLSSFVNVKIGLMVGIGGGAPTSKHDIRLGDVVVGAPGAGHGGIFQYDYGKEIQQQDFLHTSHLNRPPSIFMTTLTKIKISYKDDGHSLDETIDEILARKPRLLREYKRPEESTDRLFESKVVHDDSKDCSSYCAKNPANVKKRDKRAADVDNPAIHYGLIASANRLMKDALTRDQLAKDYDVLCFEMEAGGLSNSFPCLVIRGICDYADSHKNKEWQGYAAMVAAAFAKDVVKAMHPKKIEGEKKISDSISVLANIAQRQLTVQEEASAQNLTTKQEQCLQLFRLTKDAMDVTYEWFKDRIESRVVGTCQWLTEHEDFKKWLDQDRGPLMISADPGCGKSVLAKYLVEEKLPRSITICYFFFKDQVQNTVRQALCALIHQLISQKPFLIDHAMMEYRNNGNGMIHSTSSLWCILESCLKDSRTGSVIIVLDALDECAETEFKNLVKSVESQFKQPLETYPGLKYLLTSRPYEQIISKFRAPAFPLIHIPGEDKSQAISNEINLVIRHRVERLAEMKGLREDIEIHRLIKQHLEKRLLEIPHRTYLWVYLVFDHLEKENFKKTISGVNSAIAASPKNVYEAYERILYKSTDHALTRRILNIVLATMEAKRPLILTELNVALSIDLQLKTDAEKEAYHSIEMERDEDFKISFRNACGLFVAVYQNKIYLIHQTARTFLLRATQPSMCSLNQPYWQHSFTREIAHKTLAEICIAYLDYFNHNDWSQNAGLAHDPFCNKPSCSHIYHELTRDVPEGGYRFDGDLFFLNYSARYWGLHFAMANIGLDDELIDQAMKISDTSSKSCETWFGVFWRSKSKRTISDYTSLSIFCYLGLEAVVQRTLLEGQLQVDSRDSWGRTSLIWAVGNGFNAIAHLLLDRGANIEAKDKFGSTPLVHAATYGQDQMIGLLIKKGASIEAKDKKGQTALLCAARYGQRAAVSILIQEGADLEAKNQTGSTSLSVAAHSSHVDIVDLLLSNGANIEAMNSEGKTPLFFAADNQRDETSKLLLQKGANLEAKDKHGNTPLVWAAKQGSKAVAELFLKSGAAIGNCPKERSGSALFWAITNGHCDVVRLFLEWRFNIKAKDRNGSLPLSWAARAGQDLMAQMLLEKCVLGDVDMEAKDKNGCSALALSAREACVAVTRLLVSAGADIETRDNRGYTPLAVSALGATKPNYLGEEYGTITTILLSEGANVEAKDNHGLTPLAQSARRGHSTVAQLLIDAGADIESRDNHGHTPLALSVLGYRDEERKKRYKKSPEWYPGTTLGHETVVKLLLRHGANIEIEDNRGLTPLELAEMDDQRAIVKVLVDAGAVKRKMSMESS